MALPGPERYSHFIKVAADQRCVWGLYAEGWALYATDEGQEAFPMWPAKEYAAHCAVASWAGFEPRAIDLDTVFSELFPKLLETGTRVVIFPTREGRGVYPEIVEVRRDLRNELSRLE